MDQEKRTAEAATQLSVKGSFETVDLPEENRSGVLKIDHPGGWHVAFYPMGMYKHNEVTIRFSADVKRSGASGDLRWQVNCNHYPVVGNEIIGAETDTWYSMSGEWTGTLIHNRVFYLSTYKNNSKNTTYYIDNFKIEIEGMIDDEARGKRAQTDLTQYHKSLKDMASYLKGLIPESIPENYTLKPEFRSIADGESVRSGVLAYRDFLFVLCDRLMADGHLYDKSVKSNDSHLSMAAAYPLLHSVKNVLINIGYHGKPDGHGESLCLSDWRLLTSTMGPGGGQTVLKLSVPKVTAALRFLTDCGLYFEGIDVDAPKPDMSKVTSIIVTYPDSPVMLIGLKAMAAAQKLDIKNNDEVFLRCDYRVLMEAETDVTSLLEDFVRPLPPELQEFALKLHHRFLTMGLICKPKVSFLNIQFFYFLRNKEIGSFYASLIAGYRLLIKAQTTAKYTDVIETFSTPLQEIIAKGYGCQKKRFDEPCQKGCHGFSLSLDESIRDIGKDIERWLDVELAAASRK